MIHASLSKIKILQNVPNTNFSFLLIPSISETMEYNLDSGRMSSNGGGMMHGANSGPNSMLSTHGPMDGKNGNGQVVGQNGKMSSLSGSLYDPSIDVKIRHQLPLLNESPSLRKNRFFFQVIFSGYFEPWA